MAADLEVRGLDALVRTTREAAAMVDDLTATHAAVGAMVAVEAVDTAPRVTGQTAASVRSSGSTTAAHVLVEVPWAPALHKRNPWVARAWATQEANVIDLYTTALDAAVDHVTT